MKVLVLREWQTPTAHYKPGLVLDLDNGAELCERLPHIFAAAEPVEVKRARLAPKVHRKERGIV